MAPLYYPATERLQESVPIRYDPALITQDVKIAFGSAPDIQIFNNALNAQHLIQWSQTIEDYVETFIDDHPNSPQPLAIVSVYMTDTTNDSRTALAMVLNWLSKHPTEGYSKQYQKQSQLKVADVQAFMQVPVAQLDILISVHVAILSLRLKNHLGHQRHIRKAVFDKIRKDVLTPQGIIALWNIFTNPACSDDGLVDHIVHTTLDHMPAGTITPDEGKAINAAIATVPALEAKFYSIAESKEEGKVKAEEIKAAKAQVGAEKYQARQAGYLAAAKDGAKALKEHQIAGVFASSSAPAFSWKESKQKGKGKGKKKQVEEE
ncbi:hypothetical protein EJ08DRAFT_691483 [Tothia fuscella]|uniref:Uncharacterized protein n=1 Tax=Tothia fuscella TaxID=1048955 RepID=A0A9P4U5N9_9PEZI|nr:hypothetical protein EJ08DRAFT_691483 [Tothia fuscella]